MALALSTGLLVAPAFASQLNKAAVPQAVQAGRAAVGDAAAMAEPVSDPAGEFQVLRDANEGTTTTVVAAESAAEPASSTTTSQVRHPAKSAKLASATTTTVAKPKPKVTTKDAAPAASTTPQPKPEAKPKVTVAAAPVNTTSTTSQKSEAETLACIRKVESDGNYRAVSPSGQYRGAYQMDDDFWRTYGNDDSLAGHQEEASPAAQDAAAARGLRARGLAPWPRAAEVCA